MLSSGVSGVKRARDGDVIAAYAPLHVARGPPKRARRLSDSRPSDLPSILKSDGDGFAKFPARAAFLASLAIPDAAILGLLQGLGSDFAAFLSIVDLNLFQRNVMEVVNDFSARGVSMTTLNIRGHSFCMADKNLVLASFASSYGHQRWPCDVATYVATHIFADDERLSINVLSGGGVRDVLISEWCSAYKQKMTSNPPQVIFVISETGRVFLIPFLP